jgi:copper chaperone CopZ
MTESTFTVVGMTCAHCVASVTEEVAQIHGVIDVAVDLGSGQLTVRSATPVDDRAVQAAVDEAGYELAGR